MQYTRRRRPRALGGPPQQQRGELLVGLPIVQHDGKLELGVVTAEGLLQWGRTLARTAIGTPAKSPFVQTTKAHSVKVKLSRKVMYELDGGDRAKTKSLKARVEPAAVTLCVPRS